VKAAWRILTDKENTPATRQRYYVAHALVFDVRKRKCIRQDAALVGFHIVTKTTDRPQWIWSTFEQIDNVPFDQNEDIPQALPGGPFSFNDGTGKPMSQKPEAPISCDNPPVVDPRPMQVFLNQKIYSQAMAANEQYWKQRGIKDTIWQYYMLVATQWPQRTGSANEAPPGPTNDGNPFPRKGLALSNTTMETYFQYDGLSCMECHNTSNKSGRDFVMFVSIDAYRPRFRSPADLFSRKISGKCKAATVLSRDPMLKSLKDFFEAAAQKR
jgi:hypothetical protein